MLGANNKDAEQVRGNLICALIIRTLPTNVYKEGYCTQHGIMALEKMIKAFKKNLWYICQLFQGREITTGHPGGEREYFRLHLNQYNNVETITCLSKKVFMLFVVDCIFSCTVTHFHLWLSGRMLDSRPRGGRFEPHRRHCIVVLEQDTFIPA